MATIDDGNSNRNNTSKKGSKEKKMPFDRRIKIESMSKNIFDKTKNIINQSKKIGKNISDKVSSIQKKMEDTKIQERKQANYLTSKNIEHRNNRENYLVKQNILLGNKLNKVDYHIINSLEKVINKNQSLKDLKKLKNCFTDQLKAKTALIQLNTDIDLKKNDVVYYLPRNSILTKGRYTYMDLQTKRIINLDNISTYDPILGKEQISNLTANSIKTSIADMTDNKKFLISKNVKQPHTSASASSIKSEYDNISFNSYNSEYNNNSDDNISIISSESGYDTESEYEYDSSDTESEYEYDGTGKFNTLPNKAPLPRYYGLNGKGEYMEVRDRILNRTYDDSPHNIDAPSLSQDTNNLNESQNPNSILHHSTLKKIVITTKENGKER